MRTSRKSHLTSPSVFSDSIHLNYSCLVASWCSHIVDTNRLLTLPSLFCQVNRLVGSKSQTVTVKFARMRCVQTKWRISMANKSTGLLNALHADQIKTGKNLCSVLQLHSRWLATNQQACWLSVCKGWHWNIPSNEAKVNKWLFICLNSVLVCDYIHPNWMPQELHLIHLFRRRVSIK